MSLRSELSHSSKSSIVPSSDLHRGQMHLKFKKKKNPFDPWNDGFKGMISHPMHGKNGRQKEL